MWLDKSINVTEISSEDYEYLVNRFGTVNNPLLVEVGAFKSSD